MCVCTTQIVFTKSLTASHQNACFSGNAIRVALLYSGLMSTNIQAFHLQQFGRIPHGCKKIVFLRDTQFGFPDYMFSDKTQTDLIDQLHQFKEGRCVYRSLFTSICSVCGEFHYTVFRDYTVK